MAEVTCRPPATIDVCCAIKQIRDDSAISIEIELEDFSGNEIESEEHYSQTRPRDMYIKKKKCHKISHSVGFTCVCIPRLSNGTTLQHSQMLTVNAPSYYEGLPQCNNRYFSISSTRCADHVVHEEETDTSSIADSASAGTHSIDHTTSTVSSNSLTNYASTNSLGDHISTSSSTDHTTSFIHPTSSTDYTSTGSSTDYTIITSFIHPTSSIDYTNISSSTSSIDTSFTHLTSIHSVDDHTSSWIPSLNNTNSIHSTNSVNNFTGTTLSILHPTTTNNGPGQSDYTNMYVYIFVPLSIIIVCAILIPITHCICHNKKKVSVLRARLSWPYQEPYQININYISVPVNSRYPQPYIAPTATIYSNRYAELSLGTLDPSHDYQTINCRFCN